MPWNRSTTSPPPMSTSTSPKSSSMAKQILIGGVVVRDDQGRYLLVQETNPNFYGLWSLPAGHADPGETTQQAAVRETREETGYEVELTSPEPLVVDNNLPDVTHVYYAFRAR